MYVCILVGKDQLQPQSTPVSGFGSGIPGDGGGENGLHNCRGELHQHYRVIIHSDDNKMHSKSFFY